MMATHAGIIVVEIESSTPIVQMRRDPEAEASFEMNLFGRSNRSRSEPRN